MSALVIESSIRPPAVGLLDDEGRLRSVEGPPAAGVRALVDDWARVDRYGISIGPGSFTGLRVGLSLLKGLAFVHPRPVAAVSSLRVWAASVDAPTVAPILDARRSRVFMALFEEGRCVIEEGARTIDEAHALLADWSCVLVGDGASLLELPHERADVSRPSIEALARLVRDTDQLLPAAQVEPRYLLRTEIEERLEGAGGLV